MTAAPPGGHDLLANQEEMGVRVGVPTEVKADEYGVGITPAGVRELVCHGHQVVVQRDAGRASEIPDAAYEVQGARLVPDGETVFAETDLVRVRSATCSRP